MRPASWSHRDVVLRSPIRRPGSAARFASAMISPGRHASCPVSRCVRFAACPVRCVAGALRGCVESCRLKASPVRGVSASLRVRFTACPIGGVSDWRRVRFEVVSDARRLGFEAVSGSRPSLVRGACPVRGVSASRGCGSAGASSCDVRPPIGARGRSDERAAGREIRRVGGQRRSADAGTGRSSSRLGGERRSEPTGGCPGAG